MLYPIKNILTQYNNDTTTAKTKIKGNNFAIKIILI